MSQKQTVVINGRTYDAHTGLPVGSSAHATRNALRGKTTQAETPAHISHTKKHPAQSIHAKAQRSHTLNRKFVKKPTHTSKIHTSPAASTAPNAASTSKEPQPAVVHVAARKRIDGMRRVAPVTSRGSTQRHEALSAKKQSIQLHKPAVGNQQSTVSNPVKTDDSVAPHMPHPAVVRAHTIQSVRREQPKKVVPQANVLKSAVINETLARAPKHTHKQVHHMNKRTQLTSIICGCAALVLLGGYFTYLNVPNLSVKIAAAQAGIDASYPGYQPDGYKLNGPVAYNKGSVKMQFAANTGTSGFTLQQSRSNWDSSALLENYVKSKTNDYATTQDKGLTIYTYGSNAAWVSGGILYTINGDAPLSSDQIRKIATSLS